MVLVSDLHNPTGRRAGDEALARLASETERRGIHLLVDEVYQDTSAADGGIQAGDVMISWSGSPLESPRDLFQNLQQHEPGDQVTITVLRDGVEVELPVTLKAGR